MYLFKIVMKFARLYLFIPDYKQSSVLVMNLKGIRDPKGPENNCSIVKYVADTNDLTQGAGNTDN